MGRTLIAFLVANVVLVAGAAGTFLYTAGLPYPYISSYAFTYSYTHPPLLLQHPLSLPCDGEPLTLSEAPAFPPPGVELSLEGATVEGEGSQAILPNQSPSEPSSALGEAVPPTEAESLLPTGDASPSPGPAYPVPEPTALGEAAPPPTASPAATPAATKELRNHLSLTPVTYTIPTPLAWPGASQYHQQDELGQYNYGYANEHSAKQEFKLLDGVTRGAYNYVDAEGKLQTVSYVSDDGGFRVAATNLPQPAVPVDIPDSPEVAAAKAAHLQAQSEAVANVNIANAVDTANAAAAAAADETAAAIEAAATSASDNNAAAGCNEPSAGSSTPAEI